GGAVLTRQPDGSILAREKNPDEDTYTITARCRLPHVSALRLEVMMPPADNARERRRYYRTPSGFFLGEVTLRAAPAGDAAAPRAAAFELAWGTGVDDQVGSPANTIGGDPDMGWGGIITATQSDPNVALFVLREPLALSEGDRLTVRLVFPRGDLREYP